MRSFILTSLINLDHLAAAVPGTPFRSNLLLKTTDSAATLGPTVLVSCLRFRSSNSLAHALRYGAGMFLYSSPVMAVRMEPLPVVAGWCLFRRKGEKEKKR